MPKYQLNLLPDWVVRRRRTNRLILRSIAAEAIIFLFTILIVFLIDLTVRFEHAQIESLNAILKDARCQEAEEASTQYAQITANLNARQALAASLSLDRFDTRRLDAVFDALPTHSRIHRIDMADGRLTVAATSNSMREIEEHREKLAASTLFDVAVLDAAARINLAEWQYTLTLVPATS